MKKVRRIKKFLYDHWLVVFGVIVAAVGATLLQQATSWVTSFIGWRYSGWAMFLIAIIFIIAYPPLGKESKSKSGVVRANLPPPRYKHKEFEPKEQHGVNWRFWRGNNVPQAFDYALGDTPFRSWVDGPYCKVCDYELDEDASGAKWTCANGHKPVKIPNSIQENGKKIMIKSFDAELRLQSNKK